MSQTKKNGNILDIIYVSSQKIYGSFTEEKKTKMKEQMKMKLTQSEDQLKNTLIKSAAISARKTSHLVCEWGYEWCNIL